METISIHFAKAIPNDTQTESSVCRSLVIDHPVFNDFIFDDETVAFVQMKLFRGLAYGTEEEVFQD